MSSHMESLPHLEMKLTLLKKTLPPPPLKNEVPFQEILTRKRIQILHFINIYVSLVKQLMANKLISIHVLDVG